jgi:hypothetical protein
MLKNLFGVRVSSGATPSTRHFCAAKVGNGEVTFSSNPARFFSQAHHSAAE